MTTRTPLIRYLLLILLLKWWANSLAQSPRFSFTQYNIKDGLAGSVVHGIGQDRDGFLWFATETGLSRFDGKQFKNYTTADGLPSNEVLGVMTDGANRIWIQTFKNAVAYYYDGKIYNAGNNAGLARVHLNSIVNDLGINAAGQIAILCNNNLLTFDLTGNFVKKDTLLFFESGKRCNTDSLVSDRSKTHTVFFRGNTFWMRNIETGALKVHKSIKDDWVIQYGDSLFISKPGRPLFRMRLPTGFNELLTLNTSVIGLTLHTGGCFLLNINNPKQMQHCLPEEQVNQAWADTEGNFWFSTNGSGIFKLGSLAVKNYQLLQQKLPRQAINISKWKGRMYIGTNNGQFWQMAHDPASLQLIKKRLAPPGIGPYKQTIEPLLWHQRVFNPYQQLYSEAPNKNHFFKSHSVKTISSAGNVLLLATSGGTFRFQSVNPQKVDTIRLGRSTCALQVGPQYFIGTLDGLYIVDSRMQSFFAGDVHPALHGRIGSLGLSTNGTVWIASYSDGIIGWRNGKVTAHITMAEGLSSNNCRSLFIDSSRLWIGTEKGLNKVDVSGDIPRVVEKFSTADGLASDMINTVYVDGHTIYAGTSAGVSVFNELELERHSVCQLNMTGIYVSGKSVAADDNILQLPHANNNIRFEYAGISFRSEGRMLYRYRLLGLDSNWQQTTENTLAFPSLASGQYQLELQAINTYGLPSNIIQQRFYIKLLLIEKTWFRWACLVLLGLLLWLLFHLRLRHIQQKERQRVAINQRLAELENMALRSQMNPHFIFNSLNAVYQYVMDKDLAGANKFITDFSQLIRLTFELTALPKITIKEEIQYLRTFLELEKVKYEGQFNYVFSIMPGLDTYAFYLPPLILQAYVENSIRHGVRSAAAKGLITIAMLIENDCFICKIDDNGIGRQAAQEAMRNNAAHQSRGMLLTAERLSIWSRQAGAAIRVEVEDKLFSSGGAAGTCVTVYIPVREALNPY